MDVQLIKCSLPKHKEKNAISYCQTCKIYMCIKCQKVHSGLCIKHQNIKLDRDINDLFTGFCKEEDHYDKLEYFCKTHNVLCCSSCISKIKREGKGTHTDCDICNIEDIKNEKNEKLKENIECLEKMSTTLLDSINTLRNIFKRINENKEEVKREVQKEFRKIRNTVNEREIEILREVDEQFNSLFFKEEFIKESEKLPNKVMISLKKGKKIDYDWKDDKILNSLIYECINIEKNIKDIKTINDEMEKYNSQNLKVKFTPKDVNEKRKIFKSKKTCEITDLLESIKTFGEINYIEFKYTFKKCPDNVNENKKYLITGEKDNIIIKSGKDGEWTGVICDKELQKNKIHSWRINILKSKNHDIMLGIAPIDFDYNSPDLTKCGYFFNYNDSCLYSGEPFNYNGKETEFEETDEEITITLDLNERELHLESNSYGSYVLYNNIPLDRPLVPVVLLYNIDDSIEIIENDE